MNWNALFSGSCRPRSGGARPRGLVHRAFALAAAGLVAVGAFAGGARAQTGEPCNDCGPLDVVFIIDDTGSMGPSIAGIQAGIANIIAQIKCASDDDYQLGLITFKDCVTVNVPLASGNDAGIAAVVAGLFAFGGGNTPESSDAAVNAAVNSLPAALNCCQFNDFTNTWRPTATKIAILITDAVPGGCDDTFTPGIDDVNANQYALDALGNGILISTINVLSFSDPTLDAIMQNYATVTGGSYVYAPNAVGIEAAITAILEDCGGAGGEPPCMLIEDVEIVCDADDASKAAVTFTVTNNSGVNANYVLFTPQTPGPGSVMLTPNMIPVSIPDGSSATLSTTIMGLGALTDLSGVEICFSVTLLDPTFQICCSEVLCVTPECDCLQVPSATSIIECVPDEPGKYAWTFSFQNLTPDTLHHLYFFPPAGVVIDTPGSADNYINLVPPVAPGGTFGPVTVIICDTASVLSPGDEIGILLSIHDLFLNQCCAREIKVTIPDCDPEPITGACCRADGVCVQVTSEECEAIGIYLGDGTICGDPTLPCPGGFEFGACCLPDGTCIDLIALECEFAMGVFLGIGTDCDNPAIVCDPPHFGGCCLPDGTCLDVSVDECLAIGGFYLGDGILCGTPGVICPIEVVGACCISDGCIDGISIDFCNSIGGHFLGVGSVCDADLASCRGACCTPTGGCFETPIFVECLTIGGIFLGPGSTCLDCPPPTPLVGDCNNDGVVDTADLSGLLAAFGSSNPIYDFNGDGVVDTADLAMLLANFGATAGGGG